MKRALKQRISILLVLAMILPGTPVFAADSQAVGNSEDILQGQETGGETSQLLVQEQETDGEDPDSIVNKSIGDYHRLFRFSYLHRRCQHPRGLDV